MFVHSGECVFGNPHNDMVYLRTVGINLKSMLIKGVLSLTQSTTFYKNYLLFHFLYVFLVEFVICASGVYAVTYSDIQRFNCSCQCDHMMWYTVGRMVCVPVQ